MYQQAYKIPLLRTIPWPILLSSTLPTTARAFVSPTVLRHDLFGTDFPRLAELGFSEVPTTTLGLWGPGRIRDQVLFLENVEFLFRGNIFVVLDAELLLAHSPVVCESRDGMFPH